MENMKQKETARGKKDEKFILILRVIHGIFEQLFNSRIVTLEWKTS